MKGYTMSFGIRQEEANLVKDVSDMRKAIFRARLESEIVNRCFRSQEEFGLSGEETMVMIAFHALVALEQSIFKVEKSIARGNHE